MNCKNCIFDILNKAEGEKILNGCELLSKNCIFDILNNERYNPFILTPLWIAFKNCICWYSEQQCGAKQRMMFLLWLLLKLYLWYSEQLGVSKNEKLIVVVLSKIVSLIFWTTRMHGWNGRSCCELLSKIVSLIFWTTLRCGWMTNTRCGAFKKLYLWYSEQIILNLNNYQLSCELLSKNCIFDILNTWCFNCSKLLAVVVLSKIIFDILNNFSWIIPWVIVVVNCFQKIVSLIFWTTPTLFI